MPCVPIGIIKGKKGDTGLKGDKGDKGDRGEQGIQGPAGKNGVDGTTDTPSQVLSKLKNVDGSSSGLDADLLDGHDSSYFAKAEDLITVSQVPSSYINNSHFHLLKRNGLVQLTVDDWDAVSWLNTRTGWVKIFTLPEGYKPVVPTVSGVKNIYITNIFSNAVRMRVKCSNGDVEAYYDGSGDTRHFHGTKTWITDE